MTTNKFGREIRFGDIQKGMEILLYDKVEKKYYRGTVVEIASIWGRALLWGDVDVNFDDSDRIWVIEELRILEVNSLSLSHKPFLIHNPIFNSFLSKRHTVSDPTFTYIPSLSKSFSSFGEASEYLQCIGRPDGFEVVLAKKSEKFTHSPI